MRIRQHHFVNNGWVNYFADPEFSAGNCQLVLAFGAPQLIIDPPIYYYLKAGYPNANIVFASTSGEIIGSDVYDDSIVVTAVELERSTIACTSTHVNKQANSAETGAFLMAQLD